MPDCPTPQPDRERFYFVIEDADTRAPESYHSRVRKLLKLALRTYGLRLSLIGPPEPQRRPVPDQADHLN